MINRLGVVFVACFSCLLSCSEATIENTVSQLRMTPYDLHIPNGFDPPTIPEDNALTEERVALGKLLFHDNRFSSDGALSCSSCHQQAKGFADNRAVSPGTEGRLGFRNAPTLSNVAYRTSLLMEGGVPNLELQVLAPLDDVNEFDKSLVVLAEELQQDEQVNAMSQLAYGRDVDPFVITRALAAFERTLISGYSKYDEYLNGDHLMLTEAEQEGMKLFFSEETNCSTCHAGALFTDESFRNIGLYEKYEDKGRERITADSLDNGKFKVPTLRNIELTAPYMHDGSVETLEEVVAHFTSGGLNHPVKDSLIQPLPLTEQDQSNLVAFLKTLTDRKFVTNAAFAP